MGFNFLTKHLIANLKKGLINERTTTFFILQTCITVIFGFLYYLAVWYDISVLGIKMEDDNMQLDLFETMHFSLITQTTVGYSGGYEQLTTTGRVINFLQLFSLLAVFLVL